MRSDDDPLLLAFAVQTAPLSHHLDTMQDIGHSHLLVKLHPSVRDRLETGGRRHGTSRPAELYIPRQSVMKGQGSVRVGVNSPSARTSCRRGESDYSLRGDLTAVLLLQLQGDHFFLVEEKAACTRCLIIPVITSRGWRFALLPETLAFVKQRHTRDRADIDTRTHKRNILVIYRSVLPIRLL